MSTDATTTAADGVLETAGDRQVIRFERHLAHSIERVWAALTEPGELLGWWGEADIDLVEGGRFTMRWLNVDGEGNRYAMHATITRLDPPRLLETVGDAHGTLRWELRPVAGGTLLTFSSTLALPEEYRAMTLAGWHYHLDALATTLAGGSVELANLPNAEWERLNEHYLAREESAAAAQPRSTEARPMDRQAGEAKAEMLIRRPVAEVFEAFVNPEITSQFWFTRGSGRLEAGKTVRWDWEMYGASARVEVKAIEENKRILIEWSADGAPTTVEWRFTPRPDGTTFVSITNAGFHGDRDEIVKQAVGSTEGFTIVLAGLKALLEHGIRLNLVADRFPGGLEG